MDKQYIHYMLCDEIIYLEWISKFHPTLYLACDYVFMMGLNLTHISKRSPTMERYHPNMTWEIVALMRLGDNMVIGHPYDAMICG